MIKEGTLNQIVILFFFNLLAAISGFIISFLDKGTKDAPLKRAP